MRRVAYVCTDPGVPVFGDKGCSVHVREWLRAARRSGAHVELFAVRLAGDPPPDLEEIPVHVLPLRGGGDAAARERALQSLDAQIAAILRRAGSFDLVYERHALFSAGTMDYARANGVPGLLEVNAPLVEEQRQHRTLVDERAARHACRASFEAASALIAVSAHLAGCLKQHTASTPVHTIPNGVDCERFRPGTPPAYEFPEDAFVVGFSGSLKAWHGLDTLVAAFERVASDLDQAQLLIVGDGPERDPCEEAIVKAGLRERTHFLGARPHARIPGILASMDVAVAPYPKLDTFYFSPLKIYEYLAMGLPIVASRIGQLEAAIRSGHNGLLIEPGDPIALADAIRGLADDTPSRQALADRARESVLDQSWDQVVARTFALADDPAPLRSSA